MPEDDPRRSLTVREALTEARARGLARLDAQLLLSHRLSRPRPWLVAHDDAHLDPRDALAFLQDVDRRADGVPLAYLTGHHEFHGLHLVVTADVLDPRPDTETLVEWALERLGHGAGSKVLDLGTGSGAIALALKHARPQADVHALDASPAALAVAAANAERLGLPLQLHRGDWWQGWPGGLLDLALSNPPYIAGDDPHLPALRHEPRGALTPGGDGLSALRAIVRGAPRHLRTDAWLLLEHGHDQAAEVRSMLTESGFTDVETRVDLAGLDRCTGGRWPRVAE